MTTKPALRIVSDRDKVPLSATPQIRGYAIHYRSGTICPGCGHAHWIVGRSSAECHRCALALPLAPEGSR